MIGGTKGAAADVRCDDAEEGDRPVVNRQLACEQDHAGKRGECKKLPLSSTGRSLRPAASR